MAANQNVTQLTQQSGSAAATSLFYAVVTGTTDTGLPLSVLVNNLGLTGVPTAPTATTGTNTTQIASTAFVQAQVASTLVSYAQLASPTFTGTVTIPTVTINTGTINNTSIGATTPATGSFTTLGSTGLASLSSLSTSSATISGGSINGTSVGATTPSTGAFTTLSSTGAFTPSQTAGIVGTTTNNNANAGAVGEYVTANQPVGQALTTSTNLNVITISLTAGDWDVQGFAEVSGTSTTAWTFQAAGISTTSATFGGIGTTARNGVPYTGASPSFDLVTPTVRLQLTTTTTVYLVCVAQFTTSTAQVVGLLRARRVR